MTTKCEIKISSNVYGHIIQPSIRSREKNFAWITKVFNYTHTIQAGIKLNTLKCEILRIISINGNRKIEWNWTWVSHTISIWILLAWCSFDYGWNSWRKYTQLKYSSQGRTTPCGLFKGSLASTEKTTNVNMNDISWSHHRKGGLRLILQYYQRAVFQLKTKERKFENLLISSVDDACHKARLYLHIIPREIRFVVASFTHNIFGIMSIDKWLFSSNISGLTSRSRNMSST